MLDLVRTPSQGGPTPGPFWNRLALEGDRPFDFSASSCTRVGHGGGCSSVAIVAAARISFSREAGPGQPEGPKSKPGPSQKQPVSSAQLVAEAPASARSLGLASPNIGGGVASIFAGDVDFPGVEHSASGQPTWQSRIPGVGIPDDRTDSARAAPGATRSLRGGAGGSLTGSCFWFPFCFHFAVNEGE